MRTKIIITLGSGEEITKEYDITKNEWPWQSTAIQMFIARQFLVEQKRETLELKRAPGTCCPEPSCDKHNDTKTCESCGKSCEGCVRSRSAKS